MKRDGDSRQDLAIIPAGALKDPALSKVDLVVLASIGMYSNRAGIAWPSVRTIAEAAGVNKETVVNATKRLVRRGLLRRLKPRRDWQTVGRFGLSNRWQVLYRPDTPLPIYEEVESAAPLQHPRDRMEPDGGLEGPPQQHANQPEPPAADVARLVAAWAAGVERRWGIRPADLDRARRDAQAALYKAPIGEVLAAMEAELDTRIRAGRSMPPSIEVAFEVARGPQR